MLFEEKQNPARQPRQHMEGFETWIDYFVKCFICVFCFCFARDAFVFFMRFLSLAWVAWTLMLGMGRAYAACTLPLLPRKGRPVTKGVCVDFWFCITSNDSKPNRTRIIIILAQLNKICTLKDPVERQLPGINKLNFISNVFQDFEEWKMQPTSRNTKL